jgi:hypothetical protein
LALNIVENIEAGLESFRAIIASLKNWFLAFIKCFSVAKKS